MQNLTPGAKIALPALIAGNLHQQRIFQELNSDTAKDPQKPGKTSASAAPAEDFSLVRDGDGFLQFASRMTEAHIVERNAMKAPPKKSTLDNGNLNVSQTADVANDI